VLLTSSSTAHGLADAVGAQAAELLRGVVVASIGPITTTTAVERGLAVAVTVREHSVAGLPEALGAHWVQGPACEPQAPQL
jgi:uroporphyrinogen III methyltransferase/synthase